MHFKKLFACIIPVCLVLILSVCIIVSLYAQSGSQRDSQAPQITEPLLTERMDWWGDIEGFLDQQAHDILELTNEALTRFPPQLPEPIERRMVLLMLDAVLHDIDAPKRPPVQEFFHSRLERAINEIENTHIDEGAMIWKLYNHGWIVRTATVTIGFDLVRGRLVRIEGFGVADEVMERAARQCDVLFISHRHADHADEWVAQTFINQDKPVVAPPEVWADRPISEKITHLEREAHTLQSLQIQNGKRELKVVIYPGHQGSNVQCNVTLVFTPEGMSFAQTGDQSNDEDFTWIDEVGKRHRVDVLMPNCWTTDIVRLARGFEPELISTGHENEMGHTIDHREPNWLTYRRMRQSTYPLLLMTWGEKFHYKPKEE